MSTEQNKEIVRRIIEDGLSAHNLALIDEYFEPDFVENQFGMRPTIHGMKENFQYLYHAFPDGRFKIEDMVADGDKVWLHLTFSGTNTGGFMGPPNGKPVRVTVMDILRLKNGKVVEHWGVPDRFAVLAQLGLLEHSKTSVLAR
jgi:predicted ester cyclase